MKQIQNKKEESIVSVIAKFIMLTLTSFFNATVTIVWGIAGGVLLAGLILQYQSDNIAALQLMTLMSWMISKWIYFWSAFFVLDFVTKYWNMKDHD